MQSKTNETGSLQTRQAKAYKQTNSSLKPMQPVTYKQDKQKPTNNNRG